MKIRIRFTNAWHEYLGQDLVDHPQFEFKSREDILAIENGWSPSVVPGMFASSYSAILVALKHINYFVDGVDEPAELETRWEVYVFEFGC
jgi:hypothetical protein